MLLVANDASDIAVATAALHLIGLPVRCVRSFREALATPPAAPPFLVIYDHAFATRSQYEQLLLASCRQRTIPLLCLTTEARLDVPEPQLRRPLTPLELLGAASHAQPRLYEYALVETVEPDLEDKLCLLTHDLRRAAETTPPNVERLRREGSSPVREAASALLVALSLRDIETALHCHRVRSYARRIAQHLAPWILDDPTTELGFLLHDIGKLALPDSILQKPGPLTASERQLMQTHPVVGTDMARGLLGQSRGVNVIRHHHERWDGQGYPDRLTANAIPIEARIFAVADALDALTSDRPYRKAEQWQPSIEKLCRDTGSHFDPDVVLALRDEADYLQTLAQDR
ncbi:MAG TPA: HD-GYP domain-containing protein [Gaiellaceae bacterium]|nr:HD-GYP domain-containing protein [Gaiellaceae bacterium]